jgi:hypothetical protein
LIHTTKKASGTAQFRSPFNCRKFEKCLLYILEVFPNYISGKKIGLCFRVFPGICGKARFVCAAVGEKFFLAPTGLGGDLGQKAD